VTEAAGVCWSLTWAMDPEMQDGRRRAMCDKAIGDLTWSTFSSMLRNLNQEFSEAGGISAMTACFLDH
jgi:hypothetical protein